MARIGGTDLIEGLLRALRAAKDFRPQGFARFELGVQPIGWIRHDFAERLKYWPDVFDQDGARVRLRAALHDERARTHALGRVARSLADAGAIRGWRSETYAVRAGAEGEPLFHIERAAMRFFGLTSSAAHLSGHTAEGAGLRILIARRAASKAIDPGMLDTLVGGGVPSGQDAWQTLLRECGEEASIPLAIASAAQPAGVFEVRREVPEGLHSEILYAHDLALAADFAPRNTDGEVSEFLSLEPRSLLERIARGEMTVEAGLVSLDFMLRRALVGDPDGAIRAAVDDCRR